MFCVTFLCIHYSSYENICLEFILCNIRTFISWPYQFFLSSLVYAILVKGFSFHCLCASYDMVTNSKTGIQFIDFASPSKLFLLLLSIIFDHNRSNSLLVYVAIIDLLPLCE